MKLLSDIDLSNKKVGIRLDLNVPVKNGEIQSDERLKAALPTIQYALNETESVTIISHFGRPDEGVYSSELSLKPVCDWFCKALSRDIQFISNFDQVPDVLCMVENSRFLVGESGNDDSLSNLIASSFEVYVMDAFATAHRKSASTYGAILKSEQSCAGLLFANEVLNINSALEHKGSLVSVVGGAKVSTKLEVIKNLLLKSQKVMVGGGIANTFLKAAGHEVGNSLCEDDMVQTASEMLSTNKIILPNEVYVANSLDSDEVRCVSVNNVMPEDMILDIGFNAEEMESAAQEMIIWNGPLGIFENDLFAKGTRDLVLYLAESNSNVIAGGGETIFAINKFSNMSNFHYVSTAGGAFLEYLSGSTLPSIEALDVK